MNRGRGCVLLRFPSLTDREGIRLFARSRLIHSRCGSFSIPSGVVGGIAQDGRNCGCGCRCSPRSPTSSGLGSGATAATGPCSDARGFLDWDRGFHDLRARSDRSFCHCPQFCRCVFAPSRASSAPDWRSCIRVFFLHGQHTGLRGNLRLLRGRSNPTPQSRHRLHSYPTPTAWAPESRSVSPVVVVVGVPQERRHYLVHRPVPGRPAAVSDGLPFVEGSRVRPPDFPTTSTARDIHPGGRRGTGGRRRPGRTACGGGRTGCRFATRRTRLR
jgi:hypothetical protein